MQNNTISIIILSAGISQKMKTREPRSLLKFDGKLLVEKQYSIITNTFDAGYFFLVAGYKFDKVVKKTIDLNVQTIENPRFEETGSAESLRLAVEQVTNDRLLFIHGDLLFNKETLNVSYSESFVIIDSEGQIADKEVGAVIVNNKLTNLSYGIKSRFKWCQIAYLTGQEYLILKEVLKGKMISKQTSFEVLNEIINRGGSFNCYEPKNMKIVEIDSIKDIKYAESIDC